MTEAISPKEFAEAIGRSERSVQYACRTYIQTKGKKGLPCVPWGRHYNITRKTLEEYLEGKVRLETIRPKKKTTRKRRQSCQSRAKK